ncbi:hypothetical protein B0H10DRAFT_1796816, partial [Mycena sp. CBHHK59/15]
LNEILQIFKDATLYFSNENHCTIPQVLTTMDKVDDLIMATVTTSAVQGPGLKRALHPSIKSALKLAKATLNKYYSHTDSSNIYRIAMGNAPPQLLDYFRARKWEKAWIETAESLVREEFESNYANINSKNDDAATDVEIDAVSFHLDKYVARRL